MTDIYLFLLLLQETIIILKQQKMHENPKASLSKVAKDLSFLQNVQPIAIDRFTVKYLLENGKGQRINQINLPIDIFVSYFKYSYGGVLLYKTQAIKTSNQNDQQAKNMQAQKSSRSEITKLKSAIMGMSVNQKAWFNISDQELPSALLKNLQDEHEETKDQSEEEQSWLKQDTKERTGFHYQLYLQKIQYRNMGDFESKSRVIEQTRLKAKQYFGKGNFNDAIIKYKYISNITQNLSRSKFKTEEIQFLEENHLRAKLNYLVCYFKLTQEYQNQDQYKVFLESSLKILLNSKYSEAKVSYYNAKWLFKEKFLKDALNAAQKSYSLQPNQSTRQLIIEIKQAILYKGKIKIEVE